MRRRIFVFGSNLMGYHGGGAAKYARDVCGAEMGVGEGLTGDSYALPTCKAPGKAMPATDAALAVSRFREFAKQHPEMDFLLTAVGCGIAGFSVEQVAHWCDGMPDNVYLQAKLVEGFRK
jgi:hypothetical protein